MSDATEGWAEWFQLDPELVGRVGRRTLQWARALATGSEDRAAEPRQAAALYRLATGYLLLSPDQGREACWEAAGQFRLLGSTYANVLAVCAGDRERRRPPGTVEEPGGDEPLAPDARLHVLTTLARDVVSGDVNGDDARGRYYGWRETMGDAIALPAGQLRLPTALSVAVLDAAVAGEQRDIDRAVRDLVSRFAEVLAAAAVDRYHWTRGLSRVLPAEPEVLAPLVVAAVEAGSHAKPLHARVADVAAPATAALAIASSLAEGAR